MADIQRTVAIIFKGESDDAAAKINALEKSLDNLNTSAKAPDVAATSKAIDSLGGSAKVTETQAKALGDGLKKLAEDAGAPKESLDAIDAAMARIGTAGVGSAIVAAAALAAFGVVAASAGKDAFEFKTKVDNLNGSTEKSKDAFDFVRGAAGELEINMSSLADLYAKFLVQMDGTAISTKTAENAFIGITAAFQGQGEGLKEAAKGLSAFADATKDGNIDLKELEGKLADIPGLLRIFSNVLGVTKDDLKVLAENGALGAKEIDLLGKAMREQDYGSLTPVKDAFADLANTLKGIALDMGAETGIAAVLWTLEKTVRTLTLSAKGAQEFFVLFGTTLANVAFSIKNADWAGFSDRQDEALTAFSKNVEAARNKLLGLGDEVAKPLPDTKYKELADQLRAGGEEAEKAAARIKGNAIEVDAAKTANKLAVIEAKALADETKRQAIEAAKTEEAVRKYALELQKLASDERIKTIEAKFKLDVAELEYKTKIVQAAFESLDASIESTGKVIGDLWKLMDDPSLSFSDKWALEDQIDAENRRREEAFKLQKQLTEATIKEIESRIKAFQNGDALIKIDGAGLQPHLEAFMWEILRSIQTRVNADGLKLLLNT